MKRGKIDAKKTGKCCDAKQTVRTVGRIAGIFLAAGVALIAITDKTMKKAFPDDEEEEE